MKTTQYIIMIICLIMIGTVQADEYECIENWIPEISNCENNARTVTYTDLSICGTFDYLPSDNGTVQECGEQIQGPTIITYVDSTIWFMILWFVTLASAITCAIYYNKKYPYLWIMVGLIFIGFSMYLKYGIFAGVTGVNAISAWIFLGLIGLLSICMILYGIWGFIKKS